MTLSRSVTRNQIDSFLPKFFHFVGRVAAVKFPRPCQNLDCGPEACAQDRARARSGQPEHGGRGLTADCRAQAGSPARGRAPGPVSGVGGAQVVTTSWAPGPGHTIGPLSIQWLLIMLNTPHDQWVGGVSIR